MARYLIILFTALSCIGSNAFGELVKFEVSASEASISRISKSEWQFDFSICMVDENKALPIAPNTKFRVLDIYGDSIPAVTGKKGCVSWKEIHGVSSFDLHKNSEKILAFTRLIVSQNLGAYATAFGIQHVGKWPTAIYKTSEVPSDLLEKIKFPLIN